MRWMLPGVIAALMMLSPATAGPVQAQAKRTIRIVTTSYKFDPSIINVRHNETVVLQLVNVDTEGRSHSITAELLAKLQVAARGDVARTGVFEGRRFFVVDPGKTIEVEFIASERGTFGFICGISDHAARGHVGAINVLLPSP